MSSSDVLVELEPEGAGLTLLSGPNGSGKSTAARALVSRVEGAELLSAESQQAFYEDLLARDEANFQQGASSSATLAELVGERGRQHPLFSAFRLEPLWQRGYRLLSTGEGRKVLLLRALLRHPTLLVLDEPFDGLDANARRELAAVIEQIARQLPVLLVSASRLDELPISQASVGKVIVIEQRRVTFRGSVEQWLARGEPVRVPLPPPVHMGSWCGALDAAVPLVVLRSGRVAYGEQVVFENLDLTIRRGEHTLIEGPNGSGKSSLLEMFTGDHPQAYANDLHLFGQKRGSGESVWDIKKNVGIVSGQLHRNYRVGGSVEDVLVSGLFDSIGVYQQPEPSHRARARAWLDWLALDVTLDAAFRELSFGQQRLILIARAAIKVPPLLVMDEPTSGLDAHHRARVLALVESLCTQALSTVLMVTHREDERAFWQHRICGKRLSLARPR